MASEKKDRKSSEKKTKKRKKSAISNTIEVNGHSVNAIQPPQSTTTLSFPLASELKLPTRNDMLALDGEGQKLCFAQLGTTCERLVRLIDDTQAVVTELRDGDSVGRRDPHAVEDALIADMAKLKSLPTARRFSEQSLRKRMKRFTDATVQYVDTIAPGGLRDEVKQKHLDTLTSEYANELDAIREKEQLNVSGVQTLLKCLDETAELYATTTTTKNL